MDLFSLLAQTEPSSGFMSQVTDFVNFLSKHWEFCLLHFLEFSVWGAWFVVLGNMLNARGFSRASIGRIYACIPLGSIITPLFVGPLADKFINTEQILAISHLIGGVLLIALAFSNKQVLFYWLSFIYALTYAPTIGLVNSIVFAHDEDLFGGEATYYFPWIRVFGTIGWIAAGLSHILILRKGEPINGRPFILAGCLALILGVYCFTLPSTPPPNRVSADVVTTEANTSVTEVATETNQAADVGVFEFAKLMLSEHPVFFAVTFVAAMAMGLYFAFAALYIEQSGVPAGTVGPVMTIGQWIEIFFMLALPTFLGKDNANMNTVLAVGIVAWAIRFGAFAIGKPITLLLFGIAIHGICFDFFFAAGMINAELLAPSGLTATAQSFYGFLVYGLGMYIGSEAAGLFNQMVSRPGKGDQSSPSSASNEQPADQASENADEIKTNWGLFWSVPCLVMFLAFAAFLITTMGQSEDSVEPTEQVTPAADAE